MVSKQWRAAGVSRPVARTLRAECGYDSIAKEQRLTERGERAKGGLHPCSTINLPNPPGISRPKNGHPLKEGSVSFQRSAISC